MENFLFYNLESAEIKNKNIIKLDSIGTNLIEVDFIQISKNSEKKRIFEEEKLKNFSFFYLNSTIEKLKRIIYIYSPLTFTNKFSEEICLILTSKEISNFLIFIEPSQTVGIPFEYFDGEMLFEYKGIESENYKISELLSNKPNNKYNNTITNLNFFDRFLCFFRNENFANNK